MKKTILSLLCASAFSASAFDLGVVAARDNATSQNLVGVSASQYFNYFVAEGTAMRADAALNPYNKYSLTVGYDFHPTTYIHVVPKLGVTRFTDLTCPSCSADGQGAVIGVSTFYTIDRYAKLEIGYQYLRAESAIEPMSGSTFSVAVKFRL